jgi:2-phospho-L-lactate guanylyltransferase
LTSPVVIIPVKSSRVKSRLSSLLSDAQRREFARLLLSDVLGALAEGGLLEGTYVVSSDGSTLDLAKSLGACGVSEREDEGVNSAVLRGEGRAKATDGILVLPSDLPLLRARELKELLRLKAAGVDLVIAPSMGFNGTNALLFSPSIRLPLSYDDDSFWNHIKAAARRGLSVAVCCRLGLMFDVDTPEDFQALARSRVRSPSAAFARRSLR